MYEKLKNYSIQSFQKHLWKEILVFCLFCFLLLSNNSLQVLFYIYICYWNTFQYKYNTQITFHVVKQSHARVFSKDICLLFIPLFLCRFPFLSRLRFISWSSPPPLLINWSRVRLYLKVPNHIYLLKWYIIHCLIYFGFIECLYMHLFWKVFRENSRVTQNWVTNSRYAWFSFVKKIHAMPFTHDFSREILFLIDCSKIDNLSKMWNLDNSFKNP